MSGNNLFKVGLTIIVVLLFFKISVLSSTGNEPSDLILHIEIPSEVVETNVFTVTILANETPIKDVMVLLMDRYREFEDIKITDKYGKAQFTAPILIHGTTNRTYHIVATKTGYITNEENITIINIPNLFIKEEIKAKYKNEEIIEFTVVDGSSNPVENAILQFEYPPTELFSDKDGKVTITTAKENGHYKLRITKDGYANYLADIIVDEQKPVTGAILVFLCIVIGIVAVIVILAIAILINKKIRKNKEEKISFEDDVQP